MIPKIIYEDDQFLVLDKPPGLVVDPAETVKEETLADILQKEFKITLPRGGIVHRLDKDTSGVILVAKTAEALENLQKQFQERVVRKEYLALVHGEVQDAGVVDAAIIRNPGNREKFIAIPPGRSQSPPSRWPNGLLEGERWAVTEYEPLERLQVTGDRLQEIFSDFNKIQMRKLDRQNYGEFTLVSCHPKTGRTHQIRVHLKYINHSIVADEKYGGRKVSRLDKRWCSRIFLHAAKIGFKHPLGGEWVEFESPLPADLKKVIESLRSLEQYSSSEVEKIP